MKFNVYTIRNEDDMYEMPFFQKADYLASLALKKYIDKMGDFTKIELVKIAEYDTKTGELNKIDFEVINPDECIKEYESGKETKEIAKNLEE